MKNKKHTPLLAALATLVVLLAGVVLIWLAKVRPDVGKGRSEIVTDFLRAELLQDGQTATQVFTYDKDILTIGLEFYLPGVSDGNPWNTNHDTVDDYILHYFCFRECEQDLCGSMCIRH